LRHAATTNPDVEDGPCLIRTNSFSGVFASSSPPRAKQTRYHLQWQKITAGLALLLTLLIGAATLVNLRRIEAHAHENALILRDTRHAVDAITSTLHEQGIFHSDLVDNLNALKAEQVNVAARIPFVLAGDIVPQLDRLEAVFEASRPSGEFTPMDRVHLNRLAATLHKIEHRLQYVGGQMEFEGASPQVLSANDKNVAFKSALFNRKFRKPVVEAVEQRMTSRERLSDGQVQVTFRLEGPAATLFWVDRNIEKKYASIPAGMEVVETTRPGDCWRVRDADTGLKRLDYCATLLPSQLVVIPGLVASFGDETSE